MVEGTAPTRQPDLTPSLQGTGCGLVEAGGRHLLRVQFTLVNNGGNFGKSTVGVTARGDTGAAVSFRSAIGPSSFAIPVVRGRENVVIAVTVDSAGEFAERDEANNRMRIIVTVPAASGTW